MIDLAQWRGKIGCFHLTCVARYFREHTRQNGDRFSERDCDSLSVEDVLITWMCCVVLVTMSRCFGYVIITAFSSPFSLKRENHYQNAGITGELFITLNTALGDTVPVLSLTEAYPSVMMSAPALCLVMLMLDDGYFSATT